MPSGSGFEASNTTRPLHVARPSDVRPADGNPGPKYEPLRRARLLSASRTAGENVTASRSVAGRRWARGPAPPDSATGPVIVVSSRERVPYFASSPQARSPLAPSTVTLPLRVSAPFTQSAHGARTPGWGMATTSAMIRRRALARRSVGSSVGVQPTDVTTRTWGSPLAG